MGGLCDGGILILGGVGLMNSKLLWPLLGDVKEPSGSYMSDTGGQCWETIAAMDRSITQQFTPSAHPSSPWGHREGHWPDMAGDKCRQQLGQGQRRAGPGDTERQRLR